MARLDKQRQKRLEPKRMEEAKRSIGAKIPKLYGQTHNSISFDYNGHQVVYYPYSGWATGKSIKDGRGLQNLLKQLI